MPSSIALIFLGCKRQLTRFLAENSFVTPSIMKVGTKVSLSSYKKKIDSLLYQPSLYWASHKNFRLKLESAVSCIQEVSTLYSLGSGKRAGSTDLLIWPWPKQKVIGQSYQPDFNSWVNNVLLISKTEK